MSKKENAAQYGNTGRQRETAAECATNVPAADFTPNRMRLQELLPRSRETAVTASELAMWTGLEPREVTRQIQRLRLVGIPVCASTGDTPGYWISNDLTEITRYCKALDHRLNSIRQTREAFDITLSRLTGQLNLLVVEEEHEQKAETIPKEAVRE